MIPYWRFHFATGRKGLRPRSVCIRHIEGQTHRPPRSIGFTAELREEVKADNIGVTCFSPGTVDTSFGGALNQEEAAIGYQKWLDMGPFGDGIMKAETVAEACPRVLSRVLGRAGSSSRMMRRISS